MWQKILVRIAVALIAKELEKREALATLDKFIAADRKKPIETTKQLEKAISKDKYIMGIVIEMGVALGSLGLKLGDLLKGLGK